MPQSNREILAKYLPPNAVNDILSFIEKENVEFRIAPKRASRKGDYCCPQHNQTFHKISVNRNLNQYEFLWVTLHEFAHLLTWKKFSNKVLPHGKEWKFEFKNLVYSFLDKDTFPKKIAFVLQNHLQNPSATSNQDIFLSRAFREYDTLSEYEKSQIELTLLSVGAKFKLKENSFVLLEKRRTRFLCKQLTNQKMYLVSSKAFVQIVD